MPGKKKSLFNEGDFVIISEYGKAKMYPGVAPLFDGILTVVDEQIRGLRVWDKTHQYWIDCNPGGNGYQYLELLDDLEFEDVDTQLV